MECNFSEFEKIRKARAVHAGPRIKANKSPIRISAIDAGGRRVAGIDGVEKEVEQGGAMGALGLVYVYNDSTHDLFFLENDLSRSTFPPTSINLSLNTAAIALIKVAKSRGCNTFLTFSGIIFPAMIAVIVVPPEIGICRGKMRKKKNKVDFLTKP